MAVSLAPVAHQQFFAANGSPLAGGFIFTYSAGTTNPLATFTDSTGSTPNPNPIILDAGGFANIWLSSNIAYKFVVQNSASVTQWTVDNIIGGLVGVGPKQQIFTNGGTFTIPVGTVKVTVVGGGGAGGGGGGTAAVGSGGGAGGAAISWLSGLTPSNTLTVAVGTGGTGVSGASGGAGVASSVSSGTQTISTITANGGGGGIGNTAGLIHGGLGGTATGGTLNFGGNPGGALLSTAVTATAGGGSIFGGGGLEGFPNSGAGAAPGAGGGGSAANPGTGSNGATGIVIFEWTA
jgi:hypothetical protein